MRLMKGVITPIVTPFNYDEQQTINYKATKELIEHLIKHGVDGIFALGTNGEFQTLNVNERVEFASKVVEMVDKRLPVYANVGSCSINESVYLAKQMEKVGVDAITSVAPYFVKLNNEEMFDFFKVVATSVNIPLILYNIPKFVGYSIPVEVVEKLIKEDIGVKGIKDSSGDMELFKSYVETSKGYDFNVMVGSDSKISAAHKLGATACVAGTSNLITDTIVTLWQSLTKNENEKSEKLQSDIEVLRAVLKYGTQPSIIKRSITLANIADVGLARKPVRSADEKTDQKIKEMLYYFNLD